MKNLIEQLHLCLLSIYHRDTDKLRNLDFVLLTDQFEASGEYTALKYNPLRAALYDLMRDNKSKLNHYLNQTVVYRNSKSDHSIIQDIYNWVGKGEQAYFERYINLLENGRVDFSVIPQNDKGTAKGRSKIKVEPFRDYIITTVDANIVEEALKGICSPDSKESSPRRLALFVWKLHKEKLFKDEFTLDRLYSNNQFASSVNNLLNIKKRPDSLTNAIKNLFYLTEIKQHDLWIKIDFNTRKIFENLKREAKFR